MFMPNYLNDVGGNNSNVAWAGGCRAGGNLDPENQNRLRKLL